MARRFLLEFSRSTPWLARGVLSAAVLTVGCGSSVIVGSTGSTTGSGSTSTTASAVSSGAGASGTGGATTTSATSTSAGTGGTSTCSSGRVPVNHRATATACPSTRPAGTTFPSGVPACTSGEGCESDSDCAAGNNGRCGDRGFGAICSMCTYDECSMDADCTGGVPCVCRTAASPTAPNSCATGSKCVVDADCGPCRYCSPSVAPGSICSGEVPSYLCHTVNDACTDDADCASQGLVCSFNVVALRWVCAQGCVQPP